MEVRDLWLCNICIGICRLLIEEYNIGVDACPHNNFIIYLYNLWYIFLLFI